MLCLIDTKDFDEEFLTVIEKAEKSIFLSSEKKSSKMSLYGRVLLGYMLKKFYGINSFSYTYGENEKPYIENQNLFFNISHSGSVVICCTDTVETGCDIQEIKAYNPRVAERFFTADEYNLIENSSDKASVFTVLWSLKESILKKKASGIGGGLDRFDFSEYSDYDDFFAYGCRFTCFSYENYKGAVCSECIKNEVQYVTRSELQKYINEIKI